MSRRNRVREALPWGPRSVPGLLDRLVVDHSPVGPGMVEHRRVAAQLRASVERSRLFWLGADVMPVVAAYADGLPHGEVVRALSGDVVVVAAELLPALPASLAGAWAGARLSGVLCTVVNEVPQVVPLIRFEELAGLVDAPRASTEEIRATFGVHARSVVLPAPSDLLALPATALSALEEDAAFEVARWFAAALLLVESQDVTSWRDVPVWESRSKGASHGCIPTGERSLTRVRVVELRNIPPTSPISPATSSSSRVYEHRFFVGPFSRWQRYGPGLSERKRVVVARHIRGPKGAPFLRKVVAWTDPDCLDPSLRAETQHDLVDGDRRLVEVL